jgi:hypothetical protein
MSILELAGGIAALVLVVGFFGGLMYVFLFKSHASNQPLAARGIGIVMLAGAIKVLFLVLAGSVSTVFDAQWLDYALVAMAGVGALMMMSGLAQ